MPTFQAGFEEIYSLGSLTIKLSQPTDRKCEQDYVIHWNGIHKFSDIHLFQDLDKNITTIEEMKQFFAYFKDSPFITLNDECIKSNIKNRADVIDYVNRTSLNDTLKLCLASMIFRCDIDNINYQCPKLNGCIRHFIQILAVFAYKFNI
ncbi:hypothetical protein, partial [Arcobacter sp. CECT 9188]|uniref:hypothetical protein n=1 Tax=Arcobacter sp. CECT 9188 TaxID=2044505 RepID=UPI000E078B0F